MTALIVGCIEKLFHAVNRNTDLPRLRTANLYYDRKIRFIGQLQAPKMVGPEIRISVRARDVC